MKRALESAGHAIGATNLCEPNAIGNFLLSTNEYTYDWEDNDVFHNKGILLSRASSFKSTAVIFIPYRVFYANKFAISGSNCGLEPIPCWHDDEFPSFGHGNINKTLGRCNLDIFQYTLLNVWDDLRTRHA